MTQAGIMVENTGRILERLEEYRKTFSKHSPNQQAHARRMKVLEDYCILRRRLELESDSKPYLMFSEVAPLPEMAPADPMPVMRAKNPGATPILCLMLPRMGGRRVYIF